MECKQKIYSCTTGDSQASATPERRVPPHPNNHWGKVLLLLLEACCCCFGEVSCLSSSSLPAMSCMCVCLILVVWHGERPVFLSVIRLFLPSLSHIYIHDLQRREWRNWGKGRGGAGRVVGREVGTGRQFLQALFLQAVQMGACPKSTSFLSRGSEGGSRSG